LDLPGWSWLARPTKSPYEPEGRGFESLRACHLFMYFVYVLRSLGTGRNYVGFATDPVQRLGQHNSGTTKSTKNRGPWELVHREAFPTRGEAMRRDRFLKSGQGREELKRILGRARSSAE